MTATPTETSIPIGEWTIGSLKAYHDMMISYERQIADERDRRYHERWSAQEEAAKNLKEYQNEFRGSLSDLSTKMATKDEMLAVAKGLSEKIEAQEKVNTEFRSRLDIGNPAIGALQQQQAISAGIIKGGDITMGKIYAAIGAVGAILAIIVMIANGVFK